MSEEVDDQAASLVLKVVGRRRALQPDQPKQKHRRHRGMQGKVPETKHKSASSHSS